MLDTIIYCIQAVAPMALLVFLGWSLSKFHVLKDSFREQATKLLFNVTLPISMFTKVVNANIKDDFTLTVVIAGLAGTFATLLLAWLIVPRFEKDVSQSSVLIQGIYRSNFAVLGIPLASALFGTAGDIYSVSLLAILAPLYSIIAVFVLTPAQIAQGEQGNKICVKFILSKIFTNPLVLSVLLGIPFSLLNINPLEINSLSFFAKTLDYLSSMTLPLGMICIGVSMATCKVMNAESESHVKRNLLIGILGKLVLSPALTLGIAYLLGCRGIALGVLLVLVGGPCSVTSYVMASSMGGDRKLAASLVVYTTILSVITIVLGSAMVL